MKSKADPPAFEFAKPLPAGLLYRRCDPADLPFDLCSELADAPAEIGQERASEAIRFAIRMRAKGYNVYALGDSGTGRHELVGKLLHEKATAEETPPDWCYVNNFDDPQKPRALSLPPGKGGEFAAAMKRLVEELRASLPGAFERDEYRARHEVIDQQFKQRNEEAFGAVQQRAEAHSITLIRTPTGLAMAPKRDGKVMNPEAFEALPEEERNAIQHEIESIQGELEVVMRQVPQWEREHRDATRDLNRETTGFAIGHLIGEVRAGYKELPAVLEYLDAVEGAIKENVDDFLPQPAAPQPDNTPMPPALAAAAEDARFRRYQVNVIVDNSGQHGAPVVYEDNPTHQTLVGRAEHLARFGALVTDFNLLIPGALHRANGGYLIIDAAKLLTGNFGWPSLKRALNAGEIRIETLEQLMSMASTVALEPQPIPLDVKIVLLGPPALYYLLSAQDEEFPELFKIAADFEDRVERTSDMTLLYARMIATMVRRRNLRCFDNGAIARIVERAARLAGDSDRLTTSMRAIIDLLHEADQLAADAGKEIVGAEEVQAAIDAQFRRGDRIYRRLQEEIARGTIRVQTQGEAIGQINGLAVMTLGTTGFGNPSRITAQVRLGRGEVIDIEREVALGGPLHSKGVLILGGFLGGRFGAARPLSLHASLVFEQNYGGVDGDSASGAELFALLSALAEAPIKQCFAVTGSVDQHGQYQAIGGANEKIEGFFDVCRLTGFTGEQGVIIPASNVKHLMLRHDIVKAAAAGRFAIYPIDTIDQGLELLTGIPAGAPDESGAYPPGTLNHRIAARLDAFADKAAALLRHAVAGGSLP
ncbi:MAG TPA: AAA family ATPase [Stellaceae bacterium]|jgi:lon-related putative ATP-dependent protease|nr:AAA family ATPase [Stellaceae bacterium]